ncbi:MAG: STAS domain-containing protein [Christensenellaceae bacterium]|nr:STAS domain-containing protein [Christensenellaceae bacterium]MBR3843578.1 STAS domain-containing protein [Christensenellaceae bacterium]
MLTITENAEKTILRFEKEGELLLTLEEALTGEKQAQISISGKLRSELAGIFMDELLPLAICGYALAFDLSGLTYLSTACLDVFLRLQQKMDERKHGSMRFFGMSEAILHEFEMTGADELLEIGEE